MESSHISDDGETSANPTIGNEEIRLRSYQAEMLEASLRENIIVVQDTGSGKTHIAVARTIAELATCDPSKLVWFLAPTVALCEQQFCVFQRFIPAYGIQMLSGRDDVDHWTDQLTWDAVLGNVRIVLSTHQVLLDALAHGFVKMRKLALLIFDEAHHCTGKHPANVLLANFYRPEVDKNGELPKILGLSASPVMRKKASSKALEVIEKNMKAITKTPKLHRTELLRFVHKPQLIRIGYPSTKDCVSPLYEALVSEWRNYDFSKDPYLIKLGSNLNTSHKDAKVDEVFLKEDTYCYKQLKLLVSRYTATAAELGSSVADWYLQQSIHRFMQMDHRSEQLLDFSSAEKQYLQDILKRLPVPEAVISQPMSLADISPKVEELVDVLASKVSPDLTGLIFVEQKIWVTALAELLSLHPKVQGKLSIGTYVGNSASSKRKGNVATLIEPQNEPDALTKFKTGDMNLIIATSVLEEGIDVSECHLVICFESPKNLKSFVQRRGRARRVESEYIIFTPLSGVGPGVWEALEQDMKSAYEDDLRQLKQLTEKELEEETGGRVYEVESTGALLTLDNALPHLYHFCAILASGPYVDTRPQFGFIEKHGNVTAEVTLPLSVDPSLRVARSLLSWRTERMAVKDAAFESYKILHQNGLVNDNLLPDKQEDNAFAAGFQVSDKAPSLIEVSPPMDPWIDIAIRQHENPHAYHRTLLEFHGIKEQPFHLMFYLPVQLPAVPELTFFWNESKTILVKSHWVQGATLSDEEVVTMRDITRKILASIHHARMEGKRDDFLWFLVPCDDFGVPWSHARLLEWDLITSWVAPASELLRKSMSEMDTWGQVKIQGDHRTWFPSHIELCTSGSLENHTVYLTRVPKRRDFLHPVANKSHENEAYTRVEKFPASKCSVELLPSAFSVAALLIPSVLYRYETYLTTNSLRLGLLAPVSFEPQHLPLLVQALTASTAIDTVSYQRLEFFGDCIVKFIASVHLMADNPKWPESYLTGKKGKIISNGFFARATLSSSLDTHMIRKSFTGAKWHPRYSKDILSTPRPQQRSMISSKNLADIIESLVGASYVIGGIPKAFTCMETLLPLEKWTPVPTANDLLYNAVPYEGDLPGLTTAEQIIGYTFDKKAVLLEALTHASYQGPRAHCSYERLEFLGDAVLDYIVSKRLYAHTPELGHATMHGIRTAMANAAFLAFRMLETTVVEERVIPPDMHREVHQRCLWQFLRSTGAHLLRNRDAAIAQHAAARDAISHGLWRESVFPWHVLARTDSPKFLSDMVESVIGAVYVDSRGDIAACETFVRKLGILEALERILRDGVDCLHPKERLGILAVDKDVQYVRVEGEQVECGYRCQVRVGGVDVGGVVEGVKRLQAETIAAWEACAILEKRGKDVAMGDDGDNDDEEWFDAEDCGGIDLVET